MYVANKAQTTLASPSLSNAPLDVPGCSSHFSALLVHREEACISKVAQLASSPRRLKTTKLIRCAPLKAIQGPFGCQHLEDKHSNVQKRLVRYVRVLQNKTSQRVYHVESASNGRKEWNFLVWYVRHWAQGLFVLILADRLKADRSCTMYAYLLLYWNANSLVLTVFVTANNSWRKLLLF